MRKIRLVLLLIVFFPAIIAAQTKIGLESLVPPAPNAAELGKYGTIPVGTLTGVPEISFPLYEVTSGSLKLPISLSYHASGIQVNQKSTDVGLGWSIMAGGTISRTVYSAADNSAYGYFNYSPPSYNTLFNTTNYYTMSNYNIVGSTGYDLEPDLFAYNMGGKSGKFIYKPGQGFATIPFDPIKIQAVGSGASLTFQLVDDSGIIYKFGQSSGTISDFNIYRNTISSWYLTSMISADYTDTISFEFETIYQEDPMDQQVFPIGKQMSKNGGVVSESFVLGDQYGMVQTTQSINMYNELLVKKIIFKGGYVQFNRNTTRKDNNPATKMLDEVLVYNNRNQVIKRIGFAHDYFLTTPFVNNWIHHRLKLTGFTESDQSQNNKKTYGFDYDGTVLPVYGSYSIDYWGYYNGASNQSLIPQTTVTGADINFMTAINGQSYGNGTINVSETWTVGNANREPSATYMAAGVLNKITYPTGGYNIFEYEPHKYTSTLVPSNPVTKIGGGLRIKTIKSYSDNNSLVGEEIYAYGANQDGIGVKLFEELNFYKNYEDVAFAYYEGGTTMPTCLPVPGGNVRWQRQFLGISKYNSLNYMGSPVLYSKVTKYQGNAVANIGKVVYNYNITADPINLPADFVNSGNYGSVNNSWRQGELLNDTVYKKEGGVYVPVSTTQNEYGLFNLKTDTAILFKQHKQFIKFDGCGTDITGPEPTNLKYGQGFFSLYTYPIKTGAVRKTKETKIVYDQDNISKSVATVTTFQYQNAANRYMTETSVTTSLGNGSNNTRITRLKYPQDVSGTVQTAMISKNILTPVLEEKTYKSVSGSETLLSTVQTNFLQSGNLIVKNNILASTGAGTPETRINFNQYDINGNILEQQKTNDVKQSYLWDYGSIYPIAQVINASSADIAYTSFEADGKGNWSFNGATIRDFTTPSGLRAYNLSAGNITKSITSSSIYFISYWRPTSLSALTITGTQSGYPITGKTVNGWKYYEHKITGVSMATLSGSGLIDEVRLYPLGAQMTTYTHEPLVGVKMQCDPNNRITYYEYDGLQRLILIRDQDRNIVKKICYNYCGQTENCTLYGNVAKSGTYTRNNCSAGYSGSSVTYTVPANTYYATTSTAADQMALDDVAANGQDYANANGTCTQSCSFSAYTGFNISTSGISSSGGTVSFYIVFSSSSGSINWSGLNQVATINGNCKPNSTKMFTMSESGRTWQVVVSSSGAFSVQLLGGTPPAPYSYIGLTGGSFTP